MIPIHAAGEIGGQLYLDMAFIDGRDLDAVLAAEGFVEPARATRILAQVASALDAAHTPRGSCIATSSRRTC